MARLETLRQDASHALRALRRSPGFTATVILTLGLGIGANTAMFGIIDRLMFRPFAYLRDPAAVHRVYVQSTFRDERFTSGVSQYTTYLDLQRRTSSFAQTAGYTAMDLAVGTGIEARERRVAAVSASFFGFFDAPPAQGRYFTAAEDSTPVGAPVAVISHEFWQAQLGGRPVLGQPLQVWNIPATIIGITPPGFVGIFDAQPPAVYLPITTYAGNNPNAEDRAQYFTHYNWGWMDMLVRRKPGVGIAAANADLAQAEQASWQRMREQQPRMPAFDLARPVALLGSIKAAAGPDPSLEARTVRWVTAIALIVLLIACSNVANLFLARALRRRRETAVRLALGGGRARLMMQWGTEALALALLGCVAALAFATWGGAALRQLFVGKGAPIAVVTDWRTLGISAALAVVAALLTGLAPALVANREDIALDLKAGVREGTRQRSALRTGLVVFQVTLSVVLLVGAGLFVRSLGHVRALRLGYDVDRLVVVDRNMRGAVVPDSALVTLQARMLEVARAHPAVERAAVVSSAPFRSTSTTSLMVPGIDSVERLGQFTYQTASADYFATMGTRILRGRGFTEADRAGSARVLVVSASMARVLWPGQDAIGQQVKVGRDSVFSIVVGIAEDAAQNEFSTEDRRLRYYLPLEHRNATRGNFLFVRVRGAPELAVESIRRAVQAVMPGESYVTAQPLGNVISNRQRAWQLGATMFGAFGVLALLVAAVGLYGVIGYDVAQRTHELGVRKALGAQAGDLLRLVLGRGLAMAGAGAVLGATIAWAGAGFVEPLLFQQPGRDMTVIGAVVAALLLAAVVATLAPARRAARADPGVALRAD